MPPEPLAAVISEKASESTPASTPAKAPTDSDAYAGPLFIVLNRKSGKHGNEDRVATMEAILREAGRHYEILPVHDPAELVKTAERAVALAREQHGAVVAAGGDGTLSTVANAVLDSELPFGVLPQGTFNYFGRVNGISQDIAESTRSLLTAKIKPIQVGQINKRLFLVNASLGLYPLLLEDREAFKKRYGRTRGVAILATLWTVLTQRRTLSLHLDADGPDDTNDHTVRTPMLFVGNNALQLQQVGLPEMKDVQQGKLAAVCVKEVGKLGLIGLALKGARGQLNDAEDVISFAFEHLQVEMNGSTRRGKRAVKVAMDGETSWLQAPLVFEVAAKSLNLLAPNVVVTELDENLAKADYPGPPGAGSASRSGSRPDASETLARAGAT
ncbi:diacylglycerol kinase family protein [soil metagenome]